MVVFAGIPDAVLIWIGVLIIGLLVLVKASEYFTEAAEKLGLYFGMPHFIIGVTIVAFGTSMPELISSLYAALTGSSEIVAAEVVGSNITNILLVFGVVAIMARRFKITYEITRVDLPLLAGSAFFLILTLYDGKFTFPEGILAIAGAILFLLYATKTEKKLESIVPKSKLQLPGINKITDIKKRQTSTIMILLVSTVFIYFGAKYSIDAVVELSGLFDIGKEIIAFSAVALGTSLPELAVSIQAVRKKNFEMAAGNVLGSNIFNSFAVMGIPALFTTLFVPNIIIVFGLPLMIAATLLFFFAAQDREITMWEGGLFIIFYILFIGKLIGVV
jgi:cation:H+ antiporter